MQHYYITVDIQAKMNQETYSLKWKTFPGHLSFTFKDLVTEGLFTDVTLVSSDQIQIQAHKIVLSACSPVLKNLLLNNPHSHPLIYLTGVKQQGLQSVLQLMYFGETTAHQNCIDELMGVALDLEFKELSKIDRSNTDYDNGTREEGGFTTTEEEELFNATEEQFAPTDEEPVDIFLSMHEKQTRIVSYTVSELINMDIPELNDINVSKEVVDSSKYFHCEDCE